MKGLLLKDFYQLKKGIMTFAVLGVLYLVWGLVGDNTRLISGLIGILFPMLVLSTFQYDRICRWDLYCCATPVKRNTVVAAKYLLVLILAGIGAVVGTAELTAVRLAQGLPAFGGETVGLVAATLIMALVYMIFFLPISVRLNPKEARIATVVIIVLVVTFIPTFVVLAGREQLSQMLARWKLLAVMAGGVAVLLTAVSYQLSCYFYRRREW